MAFRVLIILAPPFAMAQAYSFQARRDSFKRPGAAGSTDRDPIVPCLDARHQVLPWPTSLKAIRNPRTDIAFSGRRVD